MSLEAVTRRASPLDNVVLVLRDLAAGTILVSQAHPPIVLTYTVLEGHRIAILPISSATPLLSWGLPFGRTISDIQPGEALFNQSLLNDLKRRHFPGTIPDCANFADWNPQFSLDGFSYAITSQVDLHPGSRTFLGYKRQNRGTGTRNHVLILGASSRVAGFVKLLFDSIPDDWKTPHGSFDGIVPVFHTEGGSLEKDNNHGLVLRTLAGWVTHPNICAALIVDHGNEPITGTSLNQYLNTSKYPTDSLTLEFLSLQGRSIHSGIQAGRNILARMVEVGRQCLRSHEPYSHLKVALQCGGSDAFSGMSGNPLAAWMARELLRYGGSANLAETSELIGAEPYVLAKVKNREVAQKFVDTLHRFQNMASWHGHSAEGNPSGGNLYRGLYNIIVKSIGAANKKHPDVRLDDVIDYGEPMGIPGFYFMDSAGNDLESIAGQVASGCNLILFITGNGSITNFPFVPTLKIVTTTQRFLHLQKDMDINAGRFLDGENMDSVGMDSFDLLIKTAEGHRTAGELAGHSQAQIWRSWHRTQPGQQPTAESEPPPDGIPIPLPQTVLSHGPTIEFPKNTNRYFVIVPTSLCSSHVASMFASELHQTYSQIPFLALSHTEGCGVSRGPSEDLFVKSMLSYTVHPHVAAALFLEHGCEKTHQSEFRRHLEALDLNPDRYQWLSIQGAGGLDKVRHELLQWPQRIPVPEPEVANITMALYSEAPLPEEPEFEQTVILLIRSALASPQGSVVMADNDPLLKCAGIDTNALPTISCGDRIRNPGLHIVETQSKDPSERLTALGATGATHTFIQAPISTSVPPMMSQGFYYDASTRTCCSFSNIAPSPFQITRGYQGFSL